MAHVVHDGFQVGAAGEEPGGVGVAEVVDADAEVDSEAFTAGSQKRVRKVFREIGVPSRW